MAADEEVIVRRTYTRARRFTQWVRWIMGWQLPVALQAAQFVTGAATLILLVQSRPSWGASLPWWVQILLILGLPMMVAIATRYLRTDGTGPTAMAAGLLSLATAPTRGRRNGKTVAAARARRIPAAYSLLADLAADPATGAAGSAWPAGGADRPHVAVSDPSRGPGAGLTGTAAAVALGARRVSVAELTRAAEALAAGQFRHPAPIAQTVVPASPEAQPRAPYPAAAGQ